MQLNYIFRINISFLASLCVVDTFQYISTEHPHVTYMNPKYLSFLNLTSRRYGRHDPFYYVGLHAHLLQTWSNNITADFYFYEWLTNQYKRSFVEMHFKLCDLINKDHFFGSALKEGFAQSCPFLPGEYHANNMTIAVKSIPPHFPFRKGRIVLNVTASDADELIGTGYIDMEIKEFTNRTKKKN